MSARRKLAIYIVEDDPTLGALEAHALNMEPEYTANWELLGPATFERVRDKSPDLIMVEVPPERTGLAGPFVEFIDRVAADPQTAAIPVVVITTSTHVSDEMLARPNVRASIAKPYDVDALFNAVRDAIEREQAA